MISDIEKQIDELRESLDYMLTMYYTNAHVFTGHDLETNKKMQQEAYNKWIKITHMINLLKIINHLNNEVQKL